MSLYTSEYYFDLSSIREGDVFYDIFREIKFVWSALGKSKKYLDTMLSHDGAAIRGSVDGVQLHGAVYIGEGAVVKSGAYIDGSGGMVHVGPGTTIEPMACIIGPTYIGADSIVGHGAYVRGGSLIGDRCLVGHCTEVKDSIMLNDSKAAHFCYVGDSILGNRVNLGAGTKLANLPLFSEENTDGTQRRISIEIDGQEIDTQMEKLGAIIGDDVKTGCNAVTNPGCLLGKRSLVYPNTTVKKGVHETRTIVSV